MMSTPNYVAIAELLADRRLAARGSGRYNVARIILGMADIMQDDNPRFDRAQFLKATGYREDDMS